jgi:transcriptional regulator with XRE-family HTH domain
MNNFGEFVKNKRIEKGFGLRTFAFEIGEDPSNWSKVERGQLNPPKNLEKLLKISTLLEADEKMLEDMAYIDVGEIPKDMKSDKELLEILPAFFSTIREKKPNKEELEILMEVLKKS